MNVEKIELGCTDLAVVNAARVSFNKWKDSIDKTDISLIMYLANHNHWTPFAHSVFFCKDVLVHNDLFTCPELLAGMVITNITPAPLNHSKINMHASVWCLRKMRFVCTHDFFTTVQKHMPYTARQLWSDLSCRKGNPVYFMEPSTVYRSFRISSPIFIARQWFKHQIGFVRNETSRRYVDFEPSFFIPENWRNKSATAKQGSDGVHEQQEYYQEYLARVNNFTLDAYNDMIANKVCPEQARMVLPQGMLTQWVETGHVDCYERLLDLRTAKDTQAETRELALKLQEKLNA